MSKSKKKNGAQERSRSADGVIQEAIGKRLSSAAFLVYAVIMALIGVAYTVSIFENSEINLVTAAVNGAVAVCALVTAIVGILFYAKIIAVKKNTVKLLGVYYTAQKIVAAASCVFGGIVSVFVFLIGGVGGVLMLIFKKIPNLIENIMNVIEFLGIIDASKTPDALDAVKSFLSVGGIALIAGSVLFAVLTFFVLINNIIAFKNNGNYIKSLAEACETNVYDVRKIPNKRSAVFGVLYVVFGIASIVFALGISFGIAAILVGVTFIFDSLIFSAVHADVLTAAEANVASSDGDKVLTAKADIAAEAKRILVEKERAARANAADAAAAAKFVEEQERAAAIAAAEAAAKAAEEQAKAEAEAKAAEERAKAEAEASEQIPAAEEQTADTPSEEEESEADGAEAVSEESSEVQVSEEKTNEEIEEESSEESVPEALSSEDETVEKTEE